MFSRKERIPREVLSTFHGRKAANRHFSLWIARNGLVHNRFAAAISKKVDPRSSRRHTLKRRAVPIMKKEGPAPGYDLFLSILPPANSLSREEFALSLRFLLSELKAKS